MFLLKLKPVKKQIMWGGEKLSRFYGIGEKGENIAEAWELTCRGDGDNVISGGEYDGRLFSEYLSEHPASVGSDFSGDRFPLLIKLIDARADLSIQVHPDDGYAAEHTDDYGKTEMWYIVEADEGAHIIYGMKKDYTRRELTEAIEKGTLEDCMNYVPVKAGETYFIPSCKVHAICSGILIAEIQQNSNITYRVYDYNRRGKDGQLRQLHVEQALDCIERFDENKIKNTPSGDCIASCEYFTVRVLNVTGEEKVSVTEKSFVHFLCIEGEGEMLRGDEKMSIKKGESVFAPASSCEVKIVSENAKIIVTSV